MWPYLKNVLIGFDQFVNTIFCGHPGETVSARSGRAAAEGKLWGRLLAALLNRIQRNHTGLAEKHDEKRAETVEYLERTAKLVLFKGDGK